MKIKIFATGGTIDKIYFDAKSEFQIGEPRVPELLHAANIAIDVEVESILRKDSLDMTDQDRALIRSRISDDHNERVLVTHGTDSMVQTAKALRSIPDKTIVLVGSMQPASQRHSDADYNIGFAMAAVQLLPAGVYIAMNGRVFDPEHTKKNISARRFESISE